MTLAMQYKWRYLEHIPPKFIAKRYGNNTGSYLLMIDGSRMFIDRADNTCLMVIG